MKISKYSTIVYLLYNYIIDTYWYCGFIIITVIIIVIIKIINSE